MFSLRRQWHRFQLARELLDEYERAERERIPLPEVMRRLESIYSAEWPTATDAAARWAEITRRKAEQFPSDA